MRDKNISIAFIGQIVPQEIFCKNFEQLNTLVDIAGNTFYNNLLEGLADHGCTVYAESEVSRELLPIKNGSISGVEFRYVPYKKNPLCRYFSLFFRGWNQIRQLRRCSKENKSDSVAIFNVLRISSALGALLCCKLTNTKTVGIVTDVPGYRIQKKKASAIGWLADRCGQWILNKFDSYVLLSHAMTEVIDLSSKPYVVIEGIFEPLQEQSIKGKDSIFGDEFSVVYAGSLHYQYGIMNLVNAVRTSSVKNICLHIYGKGEAASELEELSKTDRSIMYHGLISRERLLSIERAASLLVNPRPVDDIYAKYSFPSKNMEYLASGTPVLMTDIPSLPEEYKRYIILAANESEVELADKIYLVYSNYSKYIKMAKDGQKFIRAEKNRKQQTRKIMDFIL